MIAIDRGKGGKKLGRIAVLAGGGVLPRIINDTLIATGQAPFIISFLPEKPAWVGTQDFACLSLTQVSKLVKTLRGANVSTLVMCGSIGARPSFMNFVFDWRMYHEFPALFRALKRGDDGLLRAAIDLLERRGFNIVGVQDIAPSLLAPDAILTHACPAQSDLQDIRQAVAAAIDLGRKDIGQAVVVRGGQLIAQETRSGTAALLASIVSQAPLRNNGVLVKWSKPNQDLRVDLPSIGPDTVTQAAAAGLVGIIVEADKSLILDRCEMIRRANAHQIFVVGMRGHT